MLYLFKYISRWQIKGKNVVCFIIGLILIISCQEDEEKPFNLTVEKVSESQALLIWTPLEANIEYKLWRINSPGNQQAPQLIATLTDSEYVDGDQPLSSSVSYYVTTIINGAERRSNTVTIAGRSDLPILPYQMELIPEKNLAVIREYRAIVLLDYEQKYILKKIEFNGKIGQFDMHINEGTLEVYIPCSDKNVYIMKADGLVPTDTIKTERPVHAVAVNSSGKIFCSGSFDSGKLLVYNRENLNLLSSAPSDMDCGLFLQDDNHLIVITSHLTPATMRYYTFDDNGNFISKTDDPYGYDYEMNADQMAVSNNYIVTSTEGFVYKADETMTFVTKLTVGGSNHADFRFADDGNTIYSTLTDQKAILKSTIMNSTATSSKLLTAGYPWVLARHGNTLVVLSSPVAFNIYSVTNKVIVEKIILP